MSDTITLFLLPILFKFYFTIIGLTCKTKWHGKKHLQALKAQGQPWIYSTWHNNVAIGTWVIRNQNIGIMISGSKDGELITRCVEKFGNYSIRGSSSKGSTKATRGALTALKKGNSIAITPDGPRGPKYELQTGVLWLSALSKSPIVPFHIECSNQKIFEKSWDGHKISKLFSTVNIYIGEPIWIDKEELSNNEGEIVLQVQQKMMQNID